MSIFMDYEGIPGGQTADRHNTGLIDVDDIAWNVGRRITSHTATRHDRESANAVIGDLTLTRRMDGASPYLFLESCCGRGRTVVIRLTKTGPGEGSDVFMEYTLKHALISRYRTRAVSQGGIRPTELVRISFTALEVRYTPYDQNNRPLAPIAVSFDTSTNEKR